MDRQCPDDSAGFAYIGCLIIDCFMPKLTLLAILLSASLCTVAREVPDTLRDNSLLYNGTEYVKQFNSVNGNPFYPALRNSGNVLYYGNWYGELELLYDCQDDVVIVRDLQGSLKLQLIKEKLDEFNIDGHHFVKLKLVNARGEYYEQILKGKRQLLVQWRKVQVTDNSKTDEYALRKTVFILQDGKVTTLDNASDLYALDKPHQRELRRFYHESGYSFKKDPIKASQAVISQMEANGW
jgi:hypothetical protein